MEDTPFKEYRLPDLSKYDVQYTSPSQADREAYAAAEADSQTRLQSQQADQEAAAAKSQDSVFKQQADQEAAWADVSNKLDTQAPEDIAKDHTFRPPDVLSQYREHLTPTQISKLSKVYRAMSDAPMTAGDAGNAALNVPKGLFNWGKGTYLFLKNLLVDGDTPEEDRQNKAQAQAAYELGNAQLGETLHNFLDRAGQAEPAPGAWAPRGPMGSNDTYANINKGTSPLSGQNVGQERADIDRLFLASGLQDQKQKILEGKGEFAKFTGRDADTLAGEGVKWDPAAVEAMAPGADPMNAFFLVSGGLSVVRGAAGGFEVVNAAGRTLAKSATRELAESAIKKITGAAEATARGVKNAAGKVVGLKSTGAGVLLGSAIHTPWVVKAVGAAYGTKMLAAGAEKAAQIAGNPAVYGPLLDVTGAAAKGGLTGGALAVPFVAGTPLPQDRADILAGGVAFGAAGGLGGEALNKTVSAVAPKAAIANRMKQSALSTYYDKAPELAPVQDVSLDLDPVREAQHAELLAKVKEADPRAANLLNRMRAAMFTENRTPSYLVTPEEAVKINSNLKDKEGAFPVSVDGKKSLLWVVGKDGLNSLTHEPGHFVDTYILTPEERAHLDQINEPLQKEFDEHYLSMGGLTSEQRAAIRANPAYLKAELRAEQLAAILGNADLSGANQSWMNKGMGVVVNAMERLGIHQPGVNEGGAGTTPLGFERSFQADKFGKEIVNRWVQDPKIKEAMSSLESQANAEAEAAKAAPAAAPTGQETGQNARVEPGLATPVPDELKSNVQSPPTGAEPGAQPGLATAVPPELMTQDKSLFGERPPVAEQPPVAPVEPAKPPVISPREPVLPAGENPAASENNLRGKSSKDYDKFQGEARQPVNTRVDSALEAVNSSKDLTDSQKEAVGTLLSNLRTPHDVVYNSAKNESGSMERAPRRADVEAARGNPDLREVASKLASIPLDARTTKGGEVQIQLWSGDKVLHNLDQLLAQPKAHEFIPYELKDGKLTDRGQQELAADLGAYTKNQENGFRGNGEKLERPENPQGFIPDENPSYTPTKLSREKELFLNLLQGEAPPKSARMNVGTVPIQARAKTLAEANAHQGIEIKPRQTYKKPFEGVAISDYNPLRVKMQEAGVDTGRLSEAHEWINARDVKSATPRPDIDLSSTATDVTAASFKPRRISSEQERLRDAERGYQAIGHEGGNGNKIWMFDQPNRAIKTADAEKIHSEQWGDKVYSSFRGRYDKEQNRVSVALPDRELSKIEGIPNADDIPSGVYDALKRKFGKDVEVMAFQPSKEPGAAHKNSEIDYNLEKDFAKAVLNGRKKLEEFPYYNDYQKTAAAEAKLLKGVEKPLFIGGGPMPLSAIMLSKELGVPVLALDISPEATKLGNAVARKSGADVMIRTADATDYKSFGNHDAVILALEAGTSPEAKEAILNQIHDQIKPGTKVMVRGSVAAEFPQLGGIGEFSRGPSIPVFDGLSESTLLLPRDPAQQFMPSKEPRALKAAAVRDEDTGKIYEGPMHALAKLEYLKEKYKAELDEDGQLPIHRELDAWNSSPNLTEGSTTNEGEFLSREEAFKRADEMKQLTQAARDKMQGSYESDAFNKLRADKQEGLQFMPENGREDALEKGMAPVWFSQLDRVVASKMPNAATGEQLAAILRNPQNGIKADEMKWSGLDDFLKGKQRVTKAEVQDYLKQNRVQVKEVEKKGATALGRDELHELEQLRLLRDEGTATEGDLEQLNELEGRSENAGNTKFENYQLPGGENYRELLFTLPSKEGAPLSLEEYYRSRFQPRFGNRELADIAPADREVVERNYAHDKDGPKSAGQKVEFRSGHWDEPNVLAHTRFNERTDADGKKMLFLEEIQSDWHQKGRREGYRGGETILPTGWYYRESKGANPRWQIVDDHDVTISSGYASKEEAQADLGKVLKWRQQPDLRVPDAPFKNSWHEMVFRRMVRWAAEHGFDKIGWTTGEQQAERYDLSKQVSEIGTVENPDGTFGINAKTSDGVKTLGDKIPADKLSDYVGKELAEKIVNRQGVREVGEPGYFQRFSGPDLKVGGEGMKGFYDKILVDYANKFGKKFGAKVEDSDVSQNHDASRAELFTSKSKARDILERGGEVYAIFPRVAGEHLVKSTEELVKLSDEFGASPNGFYLADSQPDTAVHSLPITPEMKQSVMQEGVPQFMPSKFWMDKAGEVKSTDDHAKEFLKPGEKLNNDTREVYASRGLGKGSLRAQVVDDTLFLEGNQDKFESLPKAQRNAIEDMAINRGLAVNYNMQFIDGFGDGSMQFMPKKKEEGIKFLEMPKWDTAPAEAEKTDWSKYEPKAKKPAKSNEWTLKAAGKEVISKALIDPEGKPIQLGATWHHDYLQSPEAVRKYGLPQTKAIEESREAALKKGFARINYDVGNGTLTIEARKRDWADLIPSVRKFVEANVSKVDTMRVNLFNDKINKLVADDSRQLFSLSNEEKLDNLPLINPDKEVTTMSAQASGELTPGLASQFMPAKDVDLKDYIGKPVFVLTTDRMGVGHMEVGPTGAKQPMEVPGQGGRGFMHIFRNGGWAFADQGAAKRFMTRVRQVAGDNNSAIAALTVLGPENHLNSPTGLAAYSQALKAAVESGAVSKRRGDAHIKEIFSRLGKTESKLVTDKNLELFQSIKTLKQFNDAVQGKEFNFEAAKHLMERARQKKLPISEKEAQSLGIDVASIAKDVRDPGLHDVPTGQVVGLVEIPKNAEPEKSDFHFSYPWSVEGKAIGFLKDTHHVSNLTSDRRIYQSHGQVGAQPLMTVMPHLDKMEQLALAFMPSEKPANWSEQAWKDLQSEKAYNAIGHKGGDGSKIWMFDQTNRSIKTADAEDIHSDKWGDKVHANFRGRYDAKSKKLSVAFPARALDGLEGDPTPDDIPSGVYDALKRKFGKEVEFFAFMPSSPAEKAPQARQTSLTAEDIRPRKPVNLSVPVGKRGSNQQIIIE